jgi:hypothetical protein
LEDLWNRWAQHYRERGIDPGRICRDGIAVPERDALQSIASINLKKASGGASADSAVVSAYTFQDRDLLRDQIKSISPHTIVACGTTNVLVWLLRWPVMPTSRTRPSSRVKGSE